MVKGLLVFAVIVSAAFVAVGQQRPLLTDDIDITPQGAFELGAGVDFFQNAKFPLSGGFDLRADAELEGVTTDAVISGH